MSIYESNQEENSTRHDWDDEKRKLVGELYDYWKDQWNIWIQGNIVYLHEKSDANKSDF